MVATTQERLERRKYLSTLYELVLEKGSECYLVQYTQKTRRAILQGLRKHGEAIAARFGENMTFAKHGLSAEMDGWTVRFTGRTEREAISQGELPVAWEA